MSFIFFPRNIKKDPKSRKPLIIRRGDYELLSKAELKDCMDMYLLALSEAKMILRDFKDKPVAEWDSSVKYNESQMDLPF